MVPWRRSLLCVLALGTLLLSLPAPAQSPVPPCDPWAARLISYQGTLLFRRAAGIQQASASVNETFCVGDVLEIGSFSRAAIQLPDQTVVRLDQGTVITFAAPKDAKRTWLQILKGIIHIISRDPRALRVVTPFANAGIEGTEFLVRVDVDTTLVLVYEGRVMVENPLGEATAGSGQSVLARSGSAPLLQQVVRPRDQVVWTLYYPPLSSASAVGAASAATTLSLADYLARAEQRLAVGRVAEAEADLAEALKLSPGSAEVLARQSVIALTRNDAATARELADRAVSSAPGSASARLAQSYARQSAGDLPGAVATLEAAATDHPDNALVRARLAELYLASGDVDRSEASAKAAVAADPKLGLAQTILGFAKLTRLQLAAARAAFDEAIRLEPAAPLPRLGLGLSKIRDGDLAAGREEIETAVILDPNNSLVRSYMGKAYYEEKRNGLAASQLQLAKELDPNDPTPWFYNAIRKQTVNRPVEALADLRRSSALNDDRAVYRSRLLLDDDAAARNASVSALYNELGFEGLAALQGIEAVADNFGNSSAHRLLANTYTSLPRYDISRISEAFQAQIRQPLSAPPINLQESGDKLGILQDVGPNRIGINEYNSLFNRDQLRIQADLVTGSRDTWGDQFVATGLNRNVGFALSQLHYETDGFSLNNAAEKDVYGGLLQVELSPATSAQLDVKHSAFTLGYTFFPFEPIFQQPSVIDEKADTFRFNGRHATGPGSDWIWTLGYDSRQRDIESFPDRELFFRQEDDLYAGEIQHLARVGRLQVVSGGGYIHDTQEYPPQEGDVSIYDWTAYIYGQWRSPAGSLRLVSGITYDRYRQDYDFGVNRRQLSPKFGLVWSPVEGTTVRAAAFTSVRRPFLASQTIEPTEIAGFNQFFTGIEQFYGDVEGTISRRIGVAIDQTLSDSLFAGLETTTRRLEVPLIALQADRNWREESARAYVYKTFNVAAGGSSWSFWDAALSLTTEYEDLRRPRELSGSEAIIDLETWRAPASLALFGASGLTLRLVTSYVKQDAAFSIDTFEPVFTQKDDEWITDIVMEWRLPNRLGLISAGAKNVSDSYLELVDTDPLSPRVARRRIVFGSVSLVF